MKMPTVVEAARSIRTGALTSEALTVECIARIERHNPALNAFVHLDFDAALTTARSVDRAMKMGGTGLGPLAGVPFGVKDLEDCAGMPTTQGSRWFADGPPAIADSIHVGRLRAAGAIPIGKTATPEFGAWAYTASPLLGVTRNPWDPAARPAVRAAARAPPCRRAWCRSARRATAAGRSAPRPASPDSSGCSARYGRIPTFGDTHLAQNAVVGSAHHHRRRHRPAARRDGRARRARPHLPAATRPRSTSTPRPARPVAGLASRGRPTSASPSSTPRSPRCASAAAAPR